MLAKLKARVWWGYVQTGSKWADALSRQVKPDVRMAKVGFQHKRVGIPWGPWQVEPSTRLKKECAGHGVSVGVYTWQRWGVVLGGVRVTLHRGENDIANAEPRREMAR